MGKGSAARAVRASFQDVAAGLARAVEAQAAKGDALGYSEAVTVFDADRDAMPTITVLAYLNRWLTYSGCSMSSVVAAGIYLERCGLQINGRNKHRLLLSALIVSAKYLDDVFFSNSFYAAVGGSSLVEVNRLETAFLNACEWNMFVESSDYDETLSRFLAAEVAESPDTACLFPSLKGLAALTVDAAKPDAAEGKKAAADNVECRAVSKAPADMPLSCTDIFLNFLGLTAH